MTAQWLSIRFLATMVTDRTLETSAFDTAHVQTEINCINSINRLVFVIQIYCVYCEAGTEWVHFTTVSFLKLLQELSNDNSSLLCHYTYIYIYNTYYHGNHCCCSLWRTRRGRRHSWPSSTVAVVTAWDLQRIKHVARIRKTGNVRIM